MLNGDCTKHFPPKSGPNYGGLYFYAPTHSITDMGGVSEGILLLIDT